MQITFILVEPATPENVGAAARAIKTMGFDELRLINPCDHLSKPARWLAHSSGEIPENARVFKSLREATHDMDFVIGTTSKSRSVKYDYVPLEQLPVILKLKRASMNKVAIVFGREESGMRNHELKLCDMVTTVPMKTIFPSLNLAQAVMVYAWELSKIQMDSPEPAGLTNEDCFLSLKAKVRNVLRDTGINENSAIFPRYMERMNFLNEGDIRLLHSFCNKFLEKQRK